jgi:hypothetical protein
LPTGQTKWQLELGNDANLELCLTKKWALNLQNKNVCLDFFLEKKSFYNNKTLQVGPPGGLPAGRSACSHFLSIWMPAGRAAGGLKPSSTPLDTPCCTVEVI